MNILWDFAQNSDLILEQLASKLSTIPLPASEVMLECFIRKILASKYHQILFEKKWKRADWKVNTDANKKKMILKYLCPKF